METRYEKSCGAVVFTKEPGSNPRFLIILHRNSFNWGFPKGHVEEGETEEETAIREVKEEVGLDIQLIPGFRMVSSFSFGKNIHKEVVYFLGFAESEEVCLASEELENSEWGLVEDLLPILTFEDTRRILVEADIFLEGKI